jgi:two-component system response regulator MprA
VTGTKSWQTSGDECDDLGGMAQILVIDDDEQLGAALRRTLLYEKYEVSLARSGRAGLDLAQEQRPDLVVLDILLPDLDGLEICRRIRSIDDVPVLMLTARDEVADRVRGLDAGADDYLVKPFSVDEFLARIRALLRRRVPDGRSLVVSFADLSLDTISRDAYRGDRRIDLSTKEFELLALFMRRPNEVLSREVIFDQVWNYDFGNQSNLIEVYVGYLRQKLERNGESRLIHTVRGLGYVLRQ